LHDALPAKIFLERAESIFLFFLNEFHINSYLS
jgi:hypothetical protein